MRSPAAEARGSESLDGGNAAARWRSAVQKMRAGARAHERLEPALVHGELLLVIHARLLAHFGPQRWWPAETREEVILGAVLAQNTSWANVRRAIDNLRRRRALGLRELDRLSAREIAALIRPAGYFNVKAGRLKNLCAWIGREYAFDLDRMLRTPLTELREGLLSVRGVGPETADSILLYAGDLPTFVVDAYTRRILVRHALVSEEDGYAEIKAFLEDALPADVGLYNEFHALLVRLGHEFCRPRPLCAACPVAGTFPTPYVPEPGPEEA